MVATSKRVGAFLYHVNCDWNNARNGKACFQSTHDPGWVVNAPRVMRRHRATRMAY